MLKKMWDVKKEQIGKRSVFWNMMSSGLNSIVSMLLLLVVTRINGVDDAGVFSLAFSTSQMMLTIGNYGMRNYQATDINEKYSMSVYKASRIVTNMVMLLMACAFVLLNGYYIEKALVTILLCALKATDAMDDVYGGQYQRRGRLDIAGQIMSIRIVLYVIVFCLTLVITHSLLWACLLATICSLCALYMMVLSTRELFRWEKPIFSGKKVFQLLKECLPLCISSFLLIYMSNAPKYAIDTYLTDSARRITHIYLCRVL